MELPRWRDVPRLPPLWKTKQNTPFPHFVLEISSLFRRCLGVWQWFSSAWCSILLEGGRWFGRFLPRHWQTPKHYPPACLLFFLAAHFTYSEHGTPRVKLTCPQGGSNSYFLVYKCVCTVYRLQEGLWFVDQPSVTQHKPVTAEPQGPCTCDLDCMHPQRLLFKKKTTFDLLVTWFVESICHEGSQKYAGSAFWELLFVFGAFYLQASLFLQKEHTSRVIPARLMRPLAHQL